MEYRFLENRFMETRKHQLAQFGREPTSMDDKVSEVMFNTAVQAIKNVRTGNRQTCMQAVSLSTGLGKSTSAYALIATFAQHDPKFSAAYVAPTIKMAIEAQEGIEKLLGEGTTTLWSSYHKTKGVDRKRVMDDLGYVPSRTVNKEELAISEVVIVTHSQLQHELKTGKVDGVLNFMGKPRSVVFIDEHPDLVDTVNTTAEHLQAFHDRLVKYDRQHPWLPVVAQVVHRMSGITQSEGQRYMQTELLSPEEGLVFEDDSGLSLWEVTDEELSDNARYIELKQMRDAVTFLKAASKGNAFYSRQEWTFFAYQLYFNSNYSGFVLLDATSDLTGLVSLHPKVKTVEVPEVTYENLDLFHVDLPKRFNIRNVIKSASVGREYGQYIEQVVLANSSVGDEVLVVIHKDVLTQELIRASENPDKPMDWEGRRVNTQNWGAGVGLNKFKHKTHVFLFGDFYLPRAATISQTHGWSNRPLTDKDLLLAEGRRITGELYVPRGEYFKAHEGHVLRWTKQLAMRGTARQVNHEGRCFPMKLYTTMDLGRLLPNLQRLFPGVRQPVPATLHRNDQPVSLKGRQALIRLP